jgi:sulfate permease, SulP family
MSETNRPGLVETEDGPKPTAPKHNNGLKSRLGRIDERNHTYASLVTSMIAGLLAGLLILTECLSYTLLIFGDLPKGAVGLGLGSMLSAAIIATLFCSAMGSRPPLVGGPDPAMVGILSVMTVKIAAVATAVGVPSSLIAVHFLAFFALTSLVCGVALFSLSKFGAGKAAQFIPYPVVAGFLSASGLLLLYGGASVATGHAVGLTTLLQPVASDQTGRLGAAILCAVALRLAATRVRTPILLPATALLSALMIIAAITAYVPAPRQSAWYLPANVNPEFWSPLMADQVRQLNWSALMSATPEVLAIVIVLVVAIAAKLSAFEILDGQAGDLTSDMRTVSYANLVGVMFGASPLNLTGPGVRTVLVSAGGTRLSGVAVALVCGAMFVVGAPAMASIPAPLVGGFLMFSGISLLQGALMRSVRGKRVLDLAVIALVAFACLKLGYLTGLALGVVIACVMFAASYSRIGLIRRHMTRANFSSDVDYGSEPNALLRQHGQAIHVYWLSGYMFFGSSDAAFARIRAACDAAPPDTPIKFIVLDCGAITGTDASAIMSFVKLKSFAAQKNLTIAFCALSSTLSDALMRDNLIGGSSPHRSFPTRQQGLEWCEHALLQSVSPEAVAAAGLVPAAVEAAFVDWLLTELNMSTDPVTDKPTLMAYFKRRDLSGPMTLYEQGSPATQVDLVVWGQVTVSFQKPDGQSVRLRRMRHRTVVGEMGFFRSGIRTASVSLEAPALLYSLNKTDYERMKSNHPALATAFTTFIVRTLAERLEFANTEVAALT